MHYSEVKVFRTNRLEAHAYRLSLAFWRVWRKSAFENDILTLLKFDEDTFQNGYTAVGCNNLVHEHLLRKQMKDFLKAGGQFAL